MSPLKQFSKVYTGSLAAGLQVSGIELIIVAVLCILLLLEGGVVVWYV